jgi:hypothetical protein
MPKHIHYFLFLVLSLSFWMGCSKKDKPIEEMNGTELQALLDSLKKVELEAFQSNRKTPVFVTTTVQAGQGLFQVMQQAKLDNKNIIKIINAISDSVEQPPEGPKLPLRTASGTRTHAHPRTR